jgi:hypothetical protein
LKKILINLLRDHFDYRPFNLNQVYNLVDSYIRYLYPDNKDLNASVRRNLQILRDEGYLIFISNQGDYKLI